MLLPTTSTTSAIPSCGYRREFLADADRAGGGVCFHARFAFAYLSAEVLTRLFLNGDGQIGADPAAGRSRVQAEARRTRHVEVDCAGAGFQLPITVGGGAPGNIENARTGRGAQI